MYARSPVLLVEDDDEIRETTQLILEERGYEVLCAGNGQEALARLDSHARPALILLDLMMPVMDGWELMERLAKNPQWSGIPIAVVTASGAKPKGPGHVVTTLEKPLHIEKLVKMVAQFCD